MVESPEREDGDIRIRRRFLQPREQSVPAGPRDPWKVGGDQIERSFRGFKANRPWKVVQIDYLIG
jgi:hypothetical protein